MSRKTIIIIVMTIGSAIGSSVPFLLLRDVNMTDMIFWSIVTGFIGGIIGIIVGVKIAKMIN